MEELKTFRPIINLTWHSTFDKIDKDIFEITEIEYNDLIKKNPNVFPIYKNIFNFTNYLLPNEIKVCIIGQDCYHGIFKDPETKNYLPQAMGLSFSVPTNCKIPSSLNNIYENLLKYNHIIKRPTHGNLSFWAFQGVLLLNSALTVIKDKPNSCQNMWQFFTDELVKILSLQEEKPIIFVLWGKFAHLKKLNNIIKNQHLHKFIISSHPSGFSAHSPYREFSSFMDTDHFGLINEYLVENGDTPINWNIY